MNIIKQLIEYWEKQSIVSDGNSRELITKCEVAGAFSLPEDFITFYLQVNGMKDQLQDYRSESLCFYPLDGISTMSHLLGNEYYNSREVFIFAEVTHGNWWYGAEVDPLTKDYTIGVIPLTSKFIPITKSLETFITWYMNNSPELYEFGEL